MNHPRVDILLATFNGERFLKELIDSILNQHYPHIRLIIGDDGSFDGTATILKEYALAHPEKIECHLFEENVGVVLNFSRIADYSDAPYVMFADQDDLWFPTKVEETLKKMQEGEKEYGEETPLLVHSDLLVIDNKKNILARSFREYTAIDPARTALPQVLMQTVVIACTVMINRALVNRAFPIPSEADMHDYWIGLVAAAFGKILSIDKPTLYYRHHDSNICGAYRHSFIRDIIRMMRDPKVSQHLDRRVYSKVISAFIFLKRYDALLDDQAKKTLKAFITLRNHSFLKECALRLRYGFFRGGLGKGTLDLAAALLCGPFPEKYRLHP